MIPGLIDGSSAGGSLNQQAAESLACVGLAVSVFISCTHTVERRERKKIYLFEYATQICCDVRAEFSGRAASGKLKSLLTPLLTPFLSVSVVQNI